MTEEAGTKGSEPGGRWLLTHLTQILAAMGIVLTATVGVAYEYFYGRLDVRPSELGLGPQEILLHAALGFGFFAVFVLAPIAVLMVWLLSALNKPEGPGDVKGLLDKLPTRRRRGDQAVREEATQPPPTGDATARDPSTPLKPQVPPTSGRNFLNFLALIVLGLSVINWVVGVIPTILLWIFAATIIVPACLLEWNKAIDRLQNDLNAHQWRAAWDIAIVSYASLVTLFGGVALSVVAFLNDEPFPGTLALAAAGAASLNGFIKAWTWGSNFRTSSSERRPGPAARRLLGFRCDIVAATVVLAWLMGFVAVSTTAAVTGVTDTGKSPAGFGKTLYSAPISCVRIQWLELPRPSGLPAHALYVGQSSGTTVLYQPGKGPLRLPSGRLVLVPASPTLCRA